MRKNTANIITGSRIVFSIVMLFFPVFSPLFFVFYLLAGFSDMIDGTIARKTNTASEFGAKLDTVADLIFVVACAVKILPSIQITVWLWIWIGLIALIKLINILYGLIFQKDVCFRTHRIEQGYGNTFVSVAAHLDGGQN